ncbi:MAG: G8 domain-containing protein, partial [Pseudomonadota bacterium]
MNSNDEDHSPAPADQPGEASDHGAGHGGGQAMDGHGMDGHGSHDHMAALDLVDAADATHRAVRSGDWFNPSTWAGGRVPGDDAKVTIPEGLSVTYSGVSDARIKTIGVEGELRFDPLRDSKLVVDTMVVAPEGRLEAGTAARPVAEGVSIDIVIADEGDIDVRWDPTLVSRGVVALGEVEMRGVEKTSHLKVAADPMAGDATLTLAEPATGWAVGD